MKIAKVREVKTPVRGTSQSAGIDFYCPTFNKAFRDKYFELNGKAPLQEMEYIRTITVQPHERILVPSGIKVNFEGESKALIAFNKSGIASKQGLSKLAEVVDADYMGEVFINVVNTSNQPVKIKENEKLIQFLLVSVYMDEIELVDEKDIHPTKTERGEGSRGSTDK